MTSPNGGESYAPLSSQSITWSASDNIGVSSVNNPVVHVFQEDARSLYDLDGLWMDARRVRVSDPAPGRA